MRTLRFAFVAAACFLFSDCSTSKGTGTVVGGAGGAVVGGAIGGTPGAIIGGAAGAVGGRAIGKQRDKKRAEREARRNQ
ncbi:Glycine zipper [Hymenobacter gelipurpurascens]|uniref:Glycine zipper n=1 Tax=Hymenobacter gelipurpurascens TaxID=89968 RepID=A0A212T0E1_9BACT|nr:glycine zipper domain-containing protein [Hymenobacter gelipurpurascens]SNC59512.1 Glycine zipper [Hymenobacter gelipurpurascens]